MKKTETPLLTQYKEMKKKHPDAILLFRVGDFYETFGEDAVAASEILGITLTRRANGRAEYVELTGFPHHALDTYLPKLVRAGRRVAICEQLDDPKIKKTDKPKELDLAPNQTRLANGLIVGAKIEESSMSFNNSAGRFMIRDGKVGVFIKEPGNKWFFAPLILSPADEERYKLYTELSWKFSEWIWVDEYDEENLPDYFEQMKQMYDSFVERYGFLNAPANAEFIRLDSEGEYNLKHLERKLYDGTYTYGDGFDEIRERVEELRGLSDSQCDAIRAFLTAFLFVANKVIILGEIMQNTRAICRLSRELPVAPNRVFADCCDAINHPEQPKLPL